MAFDPSLICYFRDQFMPLADAKVGILTHGLSYGTGCFEGIRSYYNAEQRQSYMFRVGEHYDRFLQSADILLMNVKYSSAELSEITAECIRRSNLHTDVYMRPMAFKSSEIIGVRLNDLDEDLYVTVQPFGNYIDVDRALKVGVSSWRRSDDNAIPSRAKISGSYINSAFAKSEALMNGFDESIMLTSEGYVSEASAANLFVVRKGVVYTPPITENILEGITRNTMMTLLQEQLGVQVVERTIDRTELYVADEMFICGTGVQIAAIGSVDHRSVGTGKVGPIVGKLQRVYQDAVRGKIPQYHHWLTPVYTNDDSTSPAQELVGVAK